MPLPADRKRAHVKDYFLSRKLGPKPAKIARNSAPVNTRQKERITTGKKRKISPDDIDRAVDMAIRSTKPAPKKAAKKKKS
jgi:hypothetical protein